MATNRPGPQRLTEEEGIFYFLKGRDDHVEEIHAEKNQDPEVQSAETGGGEATPRYRESDFEFARATRTETVDESLTVGAASSQADEGPSTLAFWGDDKGEVPFDHLKFEAVTGDWNGDGKDTIGIAGDFDQDAVVDGADFL